MGKITSFYLKDEALQVVEQHKLFFPAFNLSLFLEECIFEKLQTKKSFEAIELKENQRHEEELKRIHALREHLVLVEQQELENKRNADPWVEIKGRGKYEKKVVRNLLKEEHMLYSEAASYLRNTGMDLNNKESVIKRLDKFFQDYDGLLPIQKPYVTYMEYRYILDLLSPPVKKKSTNIAADEVETWNL